MRQDKKSENQSPNPRNTRKAVRRSDGTIVVEIYNDKSAYQVVNERFNAAVIESSNRIKEIHKELGSDFDPPKRSAGNGQSRSLYSLLIGY